MVERIRYDANIDRVINSKTASKNMIAEGYRTVHDLVGVGEDDLYRLYNKYGNGIVKVAQAKRKIENREVEVVYGLEITSKVLYEATTIYDISMSNNAIRAAERNNMYSVKYINSFTFEELAKLVGVGVKTAVELYGLRDRYNVREANIEDADIERLYDEISDVIFVHPREFRMKYKKTERANVLENEYLRECMKTPVLMSLKRVFKGLTLSELTGEMPDRFRDREYAELMASKMVESGEIELSGEYYRYKWRYASDNLKLVEKHREILELRFEGETLQIIGDIVGVTRERIRQIGVKITHNMVSLSGHFKDEDYKKLILKYDVNEATFFEIFGRKDIFNYIVIRFNKDTETGALEEAIEDTEINEEIRAKIEEYMSEQRSNLSPIEKRRAQIEEVLRKYNGKAVRIDEIKTRLMEMDIENEFNWGNKFNHGLIETIKRIPNTLLDSWKKVRYYELDKYDYTELFKGIRLDREEKEVESCEKMFAEHKELMERYEIGNGDQLFSLIKKVWEGKELNFVYMPIIGFNGATLEDNLEQFIRENKGMTKEKIYKSLEKESGIAFHITIRLLDAKYKEFLVYTGEYDMDVRKSSEEELKELQSLLVGVYYSENQVKEILSKLEPKGERSLTCEEIERLGYRISGSYIIVNKYKNLLEYTVKMLNERGRISHEELREMFDRTHYGNLLGGLYCRFHAIREDNWAVDLSQYKDSRINKESLKDFATKAIEEGKKHEYFNVHYLKRTGFNHPMLDTGMEDAWYDGVIGQIMGIHTVKYYNVGIISNEKFYSFQFTEFLKEKIGEGVTGKEIIEYVNEWYGETSVE